MNQPTKEQMIEKIYEVIWCDYCDVMYDWLEKLGKYPVMIWDVLDWIIVEIWYNSNCNNEWVFETNYDSIRVLQIFHKRREKRKPIEDQSNECISFIYSQLPKNEPIN